jgi:hypothetical protein
MESRREIVRRMANKQYGNEDCYKCCDMMEIHVFLRLAIDLKHPCRPDQQKDRGIIAVTLEARAWKQYCHEHSRADSSRSWCHQG